MARLVGIDIGLNFAEASSGICRLGEGEFAIGHTYCDRLSRQELLGPGPFHMLTIDGPILPAGCLDYDTRPCEKAFVLGSFQTRCKPGESTSGAGAALRRAGCDTAQQWSAHVLETSSVVAFPRIQSGRNIVEAMPNTFIGVLLPEEVFRAKPSLGRSEKFDWLYEQAQTEGVWTVLEHEFSDAEPRLWTELWLNEQHDERAALICVVTALGVWKGRYTAVGEPTHGYFFLPAWSLWQPWAKQALEINRGRLLCEYRQQVEVWINGRCYSPNDRLPGLGR